MHDRAVRRRRAVLVALVAASLILLTAYLRRVPGRPPALGAARCAGGALADPGGREPRPEAVPRPVRLVRRHGRRQGRARQGDRRARRATARSSPTRDEPAARGPAAGQDQRDRHDRRDGASTARSTRASRSARSNSWYQRFEINKGTDDGVHRGDPVINGAGLVGKVETATGGSAVVTLITDPEFATGGIAGAVAGAGHRRARPSARPATCCSSSSTPPTRCAWATSSTPRAPPSSRLESRYPRAIPIGRVDADRPRRRRARPPRSTIKPAADLKRVDMVQVLTEPHADLDATQ